MDALIRETPLLDPAVLPLICEPIGGYAEIPNPVFMTREVRCR